LGKKPLNQTEVQFMYTNNK